MSDKSDRKKATREEKQRVAAEVEAEETAAAEVEKAAAEAAAALIPRERMCEVTPLGQWVLCLYHPAPESGIVAPEGVEHPSNHGKAKLEVVKVGPGFVDENGEPKVKPGDLVKMTFNYKPLSINADNENEVLVAGSNIMCIVRYEPIPDDEIEVVETPRQKATSALVNAAGRVIAGAN